jgi:hypothetical protein
MAGFFSDLFGGGALEDAANQNKALTQQYGTDAQGYLTTGYNTGTTNLNKQIGAYDPLNTLAGKYNQAGDLYLGALGANGPQGTAAAQAAFQNAPGYQQGLDAALGGINRAQALQGQAISGNTNIDALKYAQNLQNQQYNNWLTNLSGAGQTGVNLAGNVASGQATGYGNLANLAQTYATNQTGVAGNVLSGTTAANNQAAQAETAGAQNLLNAGLKIAGFAAAPFTGGLSAAIGSGLGSLGMTYGSPGSASSNLFGPVAPGR